MSAATVVKAAELALSYDRDWLSVSLFGGEPLLAEGVLSRVEAAVESVLACLERRPSLRWLIDTNATLLDGDALDWLAAHENASVIASLDGPAEVHNLHRVDARGHGSHAAVMAGLEGLRKRRIDFQLVAVVSPSTAAQLPASLSHLLGLGASRIALQADLRSEWSDSALAAFRQGTLAAAQIWEQEFRSGRAIEIEPLHSKLLAHLTETLPIPGRCRLGARQLTVAPSGRAYPCAEMVGEDRADDLSIGHVDGGIDASRLLALRERSRIEHEACQRCPLRARCSRGCACRQLASTGSVGGVSALLCETEASWIDAADAAANRLVADRVSAFMDMYYGAASEMTEPGSGSLHA